MDNMLQELKKEEQIEKAIKVLDEILERQKNNVAMKYIREQNRIHKMQLANNENK